jgi:hypothetical protein
LQTGCGQSPRDIAASLMTKIKEVMVFIPMDTMAKTCRRSKKRIKAVVEAEGHFYNTN